MTSINRRAVLQISSLLVSVFALAGCALSTATKTPQFSDPQQPIGESKLTIEQETDSAAVAGNLSKLIALADPSGQDGTQLAMFRTSDGAPASSTDLVTVTEIAGSCVRRQSTTQDQEGISATTTRKVWFDNSDTGVCPVTMTASQTSTHGSQTAVGGSTRAAGQTFSADMNMSFAVNAQSDLVTQGAIRSFNLVHHEEGYNLARDRRLPEMEGVDQYSKTVMGTVALATGAVVPFTLTQNRDRREIAVDDTVSNYDGRELTTMELRMPYGRAVVAYDTNFNAKAVTKQVTKIFVNGHEVTNK